MSGSVGKGDLATQGGGTDASKREEQNPRGRGVAGGGRGRRPGTRQSPAEAAGVGVCLGVSPSRGVLREGLAKGAGQRAPQPEPEGWKVAECLEGRWSGRAGAPRELAATETRPGSVWYGLTGRGVRGPSPVEEQHLPPGVEMGRNGPEHRPGSETPRPPPPERATCRKEISHPPPPPLPQRGPCRSPLPSAFTPPGGGGRA